MTLPVFAVVGRVNKGKSSIVAALTERDDVEVGPDPGTTTQSQTFSVEADGERLFTLVDTPGFQRPEETYAWIAARVSSDADAPVAVRAFVDQFSGSGDFVDECRLLEPVLDGASVLYVVDVSQPFGRSYEFEAKVLRWTGRPRIALLNKTGSDDYTDEWRKQLSPYFNIVRSFDAHRSRFEDRVSLVNILSELDDATRASLKGALKKLEDRQIRRRSLAAGVMTTALYDLLTHAKRKPREAGTFLTEEDRAKLSAEFADELRKIEARSRRRVEELYAHHRLERQEDALQTPIFDQDIFAEATWQILGLSKQQLIIAGAASGAAVGGVIDAAVAGHSFMMGTVIGGLLGAAGGIFATQRSPEVSLAGFKLSGAEWVVGPLRSPNFPWIVLDRALLHFRSVVTRSHARRDPERLHAPEARQGIVGGIASERRNALAKLFTQIGKGQADEHRLAELRRLLGEILAGIEVH